MDRYSFRCRELSSPSPCRFIPALHNRRRSFALFLYEPLVQPGRGAMDVGANIGYYALMLRQASASPIICIEPDAANLIELRRVVDENDLHDHIALIAGAAGADRGEMGFLPGINGRMSQGGKLKVPLVRIDDVAPTDVRLIKIDVEGYEHEALKGAQSVVREASPNLFVEMHPGLGVSTGAIDAMVGELSEFYSRIELYAPPKHSRALPRLIGRFRQPVISQMTDLDHGSISTFWVVARR